LGNGAVSETERDLAAVVLTTSDELQSLSKAITAATKMLASVIGDREVAVEVELDEARESIPHVHSRFLAAVAELELVAGPKVVQAAQRLQKHLHEFPYVRSDHSQPPMSHLLATTRLRGDLVDAVRRDFGIGRAPRDFSSLQIRRMEWSLRKRGH
jgi:hypothetical protein